MLYPGIVILNLRVLYLLIYQGNMLLKEVGVPKGPVMSRAVDAQTRWQLRNPDGTIEDCISFLKSAFVTS